MYDKKRNHKKIKKRRSFRAVFLTALICAAVSVLVIVGALWFVGLRYVSLNTADGTKIKFFGMVDSDGTPMRGKIVYSIATATRYPIPTARATRAGLTDCSNPVRARCTTRTAISTRASGRAT